MVPLKRFAVKPRWLQIASFIKKVPVSQGSAGQGNNPNEYDKTNYFRAVAEDNWAIDYGTKRTGIAVTETR
jgi:hypothetical protein